MAKETINNVKLGSFVLGGLLVLVMLLYMVGRNEHLFGATYTLKTRFPDAQGLVEGSNVRFSGIQVGTVKKINILENALIEVSMRIDKRMQQIIRANAVVSIGTEGLVGNKVIDIIPSAQPCGLAEEGTMLVAKPAVNVDNILKTLDHANNDVAIIASGLKTTVQRINGSTLWTLLEDSTLPAGIKVAVVNAREATCKISGMAGNLEQITADIRKGKGPVGAMLTDTVLATDLSEAVGRIRSAGETVDSLTRVLHKTALEVREGITNGKGAAHLLLYDTVVVLRLNSCLDNIQKGTEGFNQNMEALKHNFLLRGYFRKQEQQKQK